MLSRATLFSVPGGDTVQIKGTAASLINLGVQVHVKLTTDTINYSEYDLLHFFNVIRPADILPHIKASGKPYVVSTIFVDYTEYEQKMRGGIKGVLATALGRNASEYWKAVARIFLNGERINSWQYVINGHKASVQKVLRGAKVLLPNSVSEYTRLVDIYGVVNQVAVIPNAVDEKVFKPQNMVRNSKQVLCAARIEGRKNQLNLIKALSGTDVELIIIGDAAPNHIAYYNACKQIAGANVKFIDGIMQNELLQYYATSKVHVLPSWFETTGLSSLEAAAMGCNIVITDKGDTREYFGSDAFYCRPDDIDSIRQAVLNAIDAPYNKELQKRISDNYTWHIAANKTLEAYKKALT